jgi:hypothetical protein
MCNLFSFFRNLVKHINVDLTPINTRVSAGIHARWTAQKASQQRQHAGKLPGIKA